MLIDTDLLIWALRGHAKAAGAVDDADQPGISVVTYMELLQGARDKRELKLIQSVLSDMGVRRVPLTENIGHRASIYMEEYGLSVALSLADALIAAAAVENHEPLLTGNAKHYRVVKELELIAFKP